MNKADHAHEKLTTIWNWLDKLDETYEPSYLAIRDGLKHIVMSALCHVLYTSNKVQCQQVNSINNLCLLKNITCRNGETNQFMHKVNCCVYIYILYASKNYLN